jgi:cell shape-determining protein MreC
MPVVYGYGLVGRISRASPAGAQVRLITDVGVRVTGDFGRFVRVGDHDEFQKTATQVPLIEGIGKGSMIVRNLDLKEVVSVGLQEGDWAVLNDIDWPMILARMQVGRIVSIRPRPDAPLKAEIKLQPMKNLAELREVQVMTRQQ